jgi:hypothetical protein
MRWLLDKGYVDEMKFSIRHWTPCLMHNRAATKNETATMKILHFAEKLDERR